MNPRFELRPLGIWGRPVTNPRSSSAHFRATWDNTIKLLLREVDRLDGSLVVIQIDAEPADLRRDGMLRSRARVGAFPGVKVSLESRHGPLTYATDAFEGWQANVRAIALALESLRAVDRYGVSGSGEQYRGWSAITAAPAEAEMTADEARRVLADAAGVSVDYFDTPARVNIGYRIAARTAHPDAGGNDDVFRLITKARDVLLGEVR